MHVLMQQYLLASGLRVKDIMSSLPLCPQTARLTGALSTKQKGSADYSVLQAHRVQTLTACG